MTSVPPERRQSPFPETLADWFQLNYKYVAIGVGAIVAGGLGYWFYTENAERQALAAERQLLAARRSMATGNRQLANSDLKRVATTHGSTRAGVEAALLLAEGLYAERKFAEGIDVLDDFTGRGSAEYVRSKLFSLIGDGRMELGKPQEAAEDYQRAAEASRFDGERAQQRAKRARALVIAGDTAAGRKLWEELAEADAGGLASEARVRLGELSAAPITAAKTQ